MSCHLFWQWKMSNNALWERWEWVTKNQSTSYRFYVILQKYLLTVPLNTPAFFLQTRCALILWWMWSVSSGTTVAVCWQWLVPSESLIWRKKSTLCSFTRHSERWKCSFLHPVKGLHFFPQLALWLGSQFVRIRRKGWIFVVHVEDCKVLWQ